MIAEADAYKAITIADAQKDSAPLIAQAVELEGKAESKLQRAFALKRTHEEMMRQVDAVDSLASNKQTVVFGDQGNNLMAQVETYKMVQQK